MQRCRTIRSWPERWQKEKEEAEVEVEVEVEVEEEKEEVENRKDKLSCVFVWVVCLV